MWIMRIMLLLKLKKYFGISTSSLVEIKLKWHQSNGLSTERRCCCFIEMNLFSGHLFATTFIVHFEIAAGAVAISILVAFLQQETSQWLFCRFICVHRVWRNKQHLNWKFSILHSWLVRAASQLLHGLHIKDILVWK